MGRLQRSLRVVPCGLDGGSTEFEADCEVLAIEDSTLELSCAPHDPYDILPETLTVRIWLLRGGPGALQPGSGVRFSHVFVQGFNTENYGYALFATELSPEYPAGALILGGIHGDEWGYLARVFETLELELGTERCAEEPTLDYYDCVRPSTHDLRFTYEDTVTEIGISDSARLGEQHPLTVLVDTVFIRELVEPCCFDCEDDLVIVGVWPPL